MPERCCTRAPLVPPHPSYLKREEQNRGESQPRASLEPRERAMLKADQRISRCCLSVPSYPAPVLLEEVELLVAYSSAGRRNPSLLFYSKKHT